MVRMQGAKIRASISASWYKMQQQHATTTTTTTDQIGIARHDVLIKAACVKAKFVEEGPHASCTEGIWWWR